MSWLTDPELFIDKKVYRSCNLWRCTVTSGVPSFTHVSQIDDYLTLVDHSFPWKQSDFDALMTFIRDKNVTVNCQGLMVVPSFKIDADDKAIMSEKSYFRSQDVLNLSLYGLPFPNSVPSRVVYYLNGTGEVAPVLPSPDQEKKLAETMAEADVLRKELLREKASRDAAEKRVCVLEAENIALKKTQTADTNAMEDRIADLEADIAIVKNKLKETNTNGKTNEVIADIYEKLQQNKTDNEALQKKVFDLTTKLEECLKSGCGSTDQQPWMKSSTVPSNWVPFEELEQKLTRKSPFAITRSGADFSIEENTTNVLPTYFSRAIANGGLEYPIHVVSVEDLIPNKEKARFDPNVWGILNNSGTIYAFRKQNELVHRCSRCLVQECLSL